ncbi:MAG TPA: 3-isopropylmalate dehydratase small subunit [bacterium]|nr:3-isopropylmalate dehydratase small subunit [bacterium]HOC90127.1 3-isopropylmalate dehydratase small subunit [bacterium]
MEKFTILTSHYITLPVANIDTDQIIPARFLKVTGKNGLAGNLFYDWRYDEFGDPLPGFILNRPEGKRAKILVAGDNFGCGSSREHAPWALAGYGFRAIISSSFADIFRNNALKNGILPLIVTAELLAELSGSGEAGGDALLTIDLAGQTLLLPGGRSAGFAIDPFNKSCLLEGVDSLGYLLQRQEQIAVYEASHPPRVSTRA